MLLTYSNQAVSEEMLDVWMKQLTSQSRSTSTVGSKSISGMVISTLQQTMQVIVLINLLIICV